MDVKKLVTAVALCAGVASGANALTLGDILNDSTLNGVTDTGYSYVSLTDTDGNNDNAIAYLLLELAGNANTNTFGIFDTNTSGAQEFLEIFDGSDSALTSAKIQFDLSSKIATYGGNSIYTDGTFGFYIGTSAYGNLLSDRALNSDGRDYSLLFDTSSLDSGPTLGSDIVIAFEDVKFPGADGDFNDLVVGVTDVTPVPLPAGVLLLGAGVAGLGALRKKLSNNSESGLALA